MNPTYILDMRYKLPELNAPGTFKSMSINVRSAQIYYIRYLTAANTPIVQNIIASIPGYTIFLIERYSHYIYASNS